MTARLTVLASGSAGNATLLEVDGFGLLIDCGLHPKMLTARLQEANAGWSKVHAVVLTHTHSDHWKNLTLAQLRSQNVPVYAHPAQQDHMNAAGQAFGSLHAAGLARTFTEDRPLDLGPGLTVTPVRVSHDCDPTFAFRVDHHAGRDGRTWGVGYASDLGCGSEELIDLFAGADVLCLEYNHDEAMERNSPRPRFLVDRVLGDDGHLSNRQAADLTTAIVVRGEVAPSYLIQLHLSRDCNHPSLARAAGREALTPLDPTAAVVTALQHSATHGVPLAKRDARKVEPRTVATALPFRRPAQPTLPGFDGF